MFTSIDRYDGKLRRLVGITEMQIAVDTAIQEQRCSSGGKIQASI
jgi:hypothetical protein